MRKIPSEDLTGAHTKRQWNFLHRATCICRRRHQILAPRSNGTAWHDQSNRHIDPGWHAHSHPFYSEHLCAAEIDTLLVARRESRKGWLTGKDRAMNSIEH